MRGAYERMFFPNFKMLFFKLDRIQFAFSRYIRCDMDFSTIKSHLTNINCNLEHERKIIINIELCTNRGDINI